MIRAGTAALKHVGLGEYNPFEIVQTNLVGLQNVLHAAIENNVERLAEDHERARRLATAVKGVPRDRLVVFRLDDEFHSRLVESAASRRLSLLHHAVKPQLQRYEGVYFSMAERGDDSVREHEAVVEAIEAGDRTRAHDTIRTNMMNAAEHLSRHIESLGERGVFAT